MNISMPEPMRQFIETQAAAGNYSASEYVRHLVRCDQERILQKRREQWQQLLVISEAQIARGDVSHITVDELIARSEAKIAAKRKKK